MRYNQVPFKRRTMSRKRRTLADNAEVASATGKSVADWASVLKANTPPTVTFNEIVECLTKDYSLQIYWAHCIAHKLTEELDPAKSPDA
jgi:hypothetical protein